MSASKRKDSNLVDLHISSKKAKMTVQDLKKSEFLKEYKFVTPFRSDLFSETSFIKLKKQYDSAQPYKHFTINSLCQDDRLRLARNEIIDNLNGAFKETDLFKVVQTGDLANLDYLEKEELKRLQELLSLRNALYSKEFREFIQKITGCAELTEKADCSINTYLEGGHLLCHDDVITTRCVSYIVYLTDPDDTWVQSDGGCLELYPLADGKFGTADAVPSNLLLPSWNRMVLFPVQPGKSFHAVQEVLQGEKPRLSISGWFHAASPPEGAENASLQSLQCAAGQDDAKLIYQPLNFTFPDEEFQFSKQDKEFLSKFINPTYLKFSTIRSLIAGWDSESCLQLQDFLNEDLCQKIRESSKKVDLQECVGRGKKIGAGKYDVGVGAEWKLVGPAHKQRYLEYVGQSGEDTPGELLQKVKDELFSSEAFGKLIKQITDLGLVSGTGSVRRFRAGSDYTVAHFGLMTEDPRLDITLCFVDDTDEADQDAWYSDEVGGFQSYMLSDQDKEASEEVYKSGGSKYEGDAIACTACDNSLNTLLKDRSQLKYCYECGEQLLPENGSSNTGVISCSACNSDLNNVLIKFCYECGQHLNVPQKGVFPCIACDQSLDIPKDQSQLKHCYKCGKCLSSGEGSDCHHPQGQGDTTTCDHSLNQDKMLVEFCYECGQHFEGVKSGVASCVACQHSLEIPKDESVLKHCYTCGKCLGQGEGYICNHVRGQGDGSACNHTPNILLKDRALMKYCYGCGSDLCQQEADAEDDGGVISCSACSNTLNIVLRDQSLMKFVKYVNYLAPGSRWDVSMQYKLDLTQEELQQAANQDGDIHMQNGAAHHTHA